MRVRLSASLLFAILSQNMSNIRLLWLQYKWQQDLRNFWTIQSGHIANTGTMWAGCPKSNFFVGDQFAAGSFLLHTNLKFALQMNFHGELSSKNGATGQREECLSQYQCVGQLTIDLSSVVEEEE